MVILSDHDDSATPYDVFLSFRGSDTRHGFTDHLYGRLIEADIPTFRDDDELKRGEPLEQQLEKAIQQSSVSIIVFSQNYASSKWCLDEVVRILEQKKKRGNRYKVLPVFYKVYPSDVRHKRGSYKKAFNEHKKKGRVSLEKIEGWKAALTEATDLVGLVLNDGSEKKFIGEILSCVRENLPNRKALEDVPEHLFGMEYYRVSWIDSWLTNESKDDNDSVLIILGIGGIGKSTMAKRLFNEYYRQFDGSCFLARVAARWDQNEVCDLQSQLLSSILNKPRKETEIYSCNDGTQKIKRALWNKKFLLVLDDVTETEQLEALLGQRQQFYPGSKVLVTTRNEFLSKYFTLDPKIERVPCLDHRDSLELFSWHAFRQCHPPEEFKQLSEEILKRCEGLPLALTVLGSSLCESVDIVFWEQQLQKWDEIVNPDINEVMKISYDTLEDNTVKSLFLHIACFFVGEEEDYIVKILERRGMHAAVGIQSLIKRSLITVDYKKLMMHQVIQDMGREIVRQESPDEPGQRSRLWSHEDSLVVLRYDRGTEAVRGLILDGQKLKKVESDGSRFAPSDANPSSLTKLLGYVKRKREEVLDKFLPSKEGDLKIDAFAKMINLEIVKLNHVDLTGSYKKFSEKLRWISWHGFSQEYVPMELPVQNLIAFDLEHSRLKQVWKGYKVVYEFGIFSCCVVGRSEVPSCFTTYPIPSPIEGKKYPLSWHSPSIPYTIPYSAKKIQGLNICFAIRMKKRLTAYSSADFSVRIRNKTKEYVWRYELRQSSCLFLKIPIGEVNLWVSTWKCMDVMEAGDKLEISYSVSGILARYFDEYQEVKEFGIRMVYEEVTDLRDNSTSLLWTDEMNVSCSNYHTRGTGYYFRSSHLWVNVANDYYSQPYPMWLDPEGEGPNEYTVQHVDWFDNRERTFNSVIFKS